MEPDTRGLSATFGYLTELYLCRTVAVALTAMRTNNRYATNHRLILDLR